MRDAFDTEIIRASIPSLQDTMELDAMKEVLKELDTEAIEISDVSMQDAPDSDFEPADFGADPGTLNQLAEAEPAALAEPAEPAKPTKPAEPIEQAESSSSIQPVQAVKRNTSKDDQELIMAPLLSPTKLGAQQALDSPVVEIKLPIPAPWNHNLPYILSTYLQLAFNAGLLIAAGLLAKAYKGDVDKHMSETAALIARKAAQCAELYVQNECRPGLRRPALEEYCEELEECMEKDPEAVKRISAHAATLAGFINDFLNPLSFKAIFLLTVIGLVVAFVANYLFGFVRARTYYGVRHPPQSQPVASYRLSAKQGNIWR